MEWKLTDSRPIWQQLTEQITLRILKGEYPPGGRLPAVRDLAVQAGVNPNTMQRAMAPVSYTHLDVYKRQPQIYPFIRNGKRLFCGKFYKKPALSSDYLLKSASI